jgi:hypothetical protein
MQVWNVFQENLLIFQVNHVPRKHEACLNDSSKHLRTVLQRRDTMKCRRKYGSKFSADTNLTYKKVNTPTIRQREKNKHSLYSSMQTLAYFNLKYTHCSTCFGMNIIFFLCFFMNARCYCFIIYILLC